MDSALRGSVLLLLLSLIAALLPSEAGAASGRRPCQPQKQFARDAEQELLDAIKKSRLKEKVPQDLKDSCRGDDEESRVRMWVEVMRGISWPESSWDQQCSSGVKNSQTSEENRGSDGYENSHGLYQMTYGDRAGRYNCFQSQAEVFDAKLNARCAVKKMEELMGHNDRLQTDGSNRGAAQYWGIFRPAQFEKKGKKVIEGVKAACRELGQGQFFDWPSQWENLAVGKGADSASTSSGKVLHRRSRTGQATGAQ